MDNKDKKIVGYNENGFPIYGEAASEYVYSDPINKLIKMSIIEKIICFVMYLAAIPYAFSGFLNTNGGIIAGIIIVSFVLIDIIIFKIKIKKESKNIINNDINNKKSSLTKYILIFIAVVIIYFAFYISMGNQYNAFNADGNGWSDETGGAAGWFALLMFWPSYVFCLCALISTTVIFLNRTKRKICEKILKKA